MEDNKVFAALSYLGPLLIVPLLMSRDSDYIRFHARRGLVLFFAEVLLSFLFWNPLFMMLLGLAFIVISLYGFVQAVLGHHWKPKVLSDIADRIRL
ncbi:hypothetical protein AMJ57_00355 [Parcubacteria bacterium SG8_24]|nr:MAG: hypothetical protein AMJ57_00355 [Parcubacteria bacterium SG8_24]